MFYFFFCGFAPKNSEAMIPTSKNPTPLICNPQLLIKSCNGSRPGDTILLLCTLDMWNSESSQWVCWRAFINKSSKSRIQWPEIVFLRKLWKKWRSKVVRHTVTMAVWLMIWKTSRVLNHVTFPWNVWAFLPSKSPTFTEEGAPCLGPTSFRPASQRSSVAARPPPHRTTVPRPACHMPYLSWHGLV